MTSIDVAIKTFGT